MFSSLPFVATLIFSLIGTAFAVPAPSALSQRDGPSGQVSFPSTTQRIYDGLRFTYRPVEQVAGSSGQVTTGLILNLVQNATVVPLGSVFSVQQLSPNYVNGPYSVVFDLVRTTRQGFGCGDWAVAVTEFQSGPIYYGTFLAAAPTITFTGC